MLEKSTKAGRKAIPDVHRTKVFGLSVLGIAHDAYSKMRVEEQRLVRQRTRKCFESIVMQILGGHMVASDDRGNKS